MQQRWLRGLVLCAMLIAAVWLRAVVDGRGELRQGRAAMGEGDLVTAVVHLGRAGRWRAPLTTHALDALAELDKVGAQAELARDLPLALAAHRERRRAVLATRTFAGPAYPTHLDQANTAIARLMATQGYDAARAEAELKAPTPGPTTGTLLAALSFLAWVIALVVLIMRGINDDGTWRRPFAVRVGMLALVLTPIWMWLTAVG